MFLLSSLAQSLHDMFVLGLPIEEKIARPVIVYFSLIALLRVFGKRELAQLNPFDLVVLLSLSNTVQNAIIGDDNSVTGGLVGAVTLLSLNYLVVRFLRRNKEVDQILEGTPTVLIEKGVVCRKALEEELITESDLFAVARRQGFASLDEIESCILEANGTFSIFGRTPSTGEIRQTEVLESLEQIRVEIQALRKEISSASRAPAGA